MDDPMTDLMPCPWCGGEMQYRAALWPSDGDHDGIMHKASTPECGLVEFSTGTSDGQIIAAWNRRADDAALQAAERRGMERAAEKLAALAKHPANLGSEREKTYRDAEAAIRSLTQGGDGNVE